ncbi:putative protein p58 [Rose leaf rosette-associated virus]|uniref:P61 n=1 Tax=Rose leaf rosette-associated virus TaxID=1543207 RepID=A0A088MGX5_9CLOS|nr:putative protein p58 [Rose leaf rosette-associated virus]AIN39541.1 putative protein p58 [Rose leaf rosette-associated virus]
MSLTHEWGSLFRGVYGEPMWSQFLSDAAKTYNSSVFQEDHVTKDKTKILAKTLRSAPMGSRDHEIALLHHSNNMTGWSEICGIPKAMFLQGSEEVRSDVTLFMDVDPTKVGCRFSMDTVKNFIVDTCGEKDIAKVRVEHSWALSNACGKLTDADDLHEYKAMVFGEKSKDSVIDAVDCPFGDYLSHCLGLYKKCTVATDSEMRVRAEFFKYMAEIVNAYDLNYNEPSDNPVLTGIMLDFVLSRKIFPSSYAVNLANLRKFIYDFLPMILKVWVVTPRDVHFDERLIPPCELVDLAMDVPKFNFHDLNTVIKGKLRSLEIECEDPDMNVISEIVFSKLEADNRNVDKHLLREALFLYYGKYCTAKTRVVPRPSRFRVSGVEVSFTAVESWFSRVQFAELNINFRRDFMSHHATEALQVYKKFGVKYPPKSDYIVPLNMAYLNFDFYKGVKDSGVNEEEHYHLKKICAAVDAKCRGLYSLQKVSENDVRRRVGKRGRRRRGELRTPNA